MNRLNITKLLTKIKRMATRKNEIRISGTTMLILKGDAFLLANFADRVRALFPEVAIDLSRFLDVDCNTSMYLEGPSVCIAAILHSATKEGLIG